MRRVLDTEMRCDAESRNTAWHNLTSPTPFHHFDASLFYSSAQSDASELSVAAIYEQYRVDAPDSQLEAGPAPSPVFTLSDVTGSVNVDLLRAVFLLSDIVVLLYRLTATYVTVRALRRRFTACTICRRSTSCPPTGQGAGVTGGQVVADGGSTSSRTALTTTSSTGVVPDTSNIYIDPQSLVVENCDTLVRRPVTSVDTNCSYPRRRNDAKYPPGQIGAVLAITHVYLVTATLAYKRLLIGHYQRGLISSPYLRIMSTAVEVMRLSFVVFHVSLNDGPYMLL